MQKVKLNQENSQIKKQKDTVDQFEQSVENKVNEIQDKNNRGFLYAQQFLKLLSDKTVPENQDPRVKKGEIAFIKTLTDFASELNSFEDNRQREILSDLGSNSLIATLLKGMLMQRNRINVLEYQFHLLEEKFKKDIKNG